MNPVVFLPEQGMSSGVKIEHDPAKAKITFTAWYSHFYAHSIPTTMTLVEFFKMMGVTQLECLQAFEEMEKSK